MSRPHRPVPQLDLPGLLPFALPATTVAANVGFNIDFRNGTWNQSAVGGPTASTGWSVNPSTSRGFTTGSAYYPDADLTLTVKTQFLGTATFGANNMTLNPSNTSGFAIQNAGTGDENGANLLNYQRIDFSFSTPVTMYFLELRDIDTATSSGVQGWRDATTVELWNNAAPGDGITPTISLYSPTNLTVFQSTYPLPYTYATTLDNTLCSNRSAAIFSYDAQVVDGFSIDLWNAGSGTGGKHAVVLQAVGNRFLVDVPEPSTLLLLLSGLLPARRKRSV